MDSADLIVKARVSGISDSEWATENGKRPENIELEDIKGIHRNVQLHTTKILKGSADERISVKVQGGSIGDYRAISSTGPKFTENESFLVFLRKINGELWYSAANTEHTIHRNNWSHEQVYLKNMIARST